VTTTWDKKNSTVSVYNSPTTSPTHCLAAEDEFSGSTRRAVSL